MFCLRGAHDTSDPSFAVALIFLFLYVVTFTIVLAVGGQSDTDPRMLMLAGNLISWVTQSKVLRDFKGTHHIMSSGERDKYLNSLGKKYGLGLFPAWMIGCD